MSSKAYPFVSLGSSLKPLMDLGLPYFSLLQAQVFYFYGVQFIVPHQHPNIEPFQSTSPHYYKNDFALLLHRDLRLGLFI